MSRTFVAQLVGRPQGSPTTLLPSGCNSPSWKKVRPGVRGLEERAAQLPEEHHFYLRDKKKLGISASIRASPRRCNGDHVRSFSTIPGHRGRRGGGRSGKVQGSTNSTKRGAGGRRPKSVLPNSMSTHGLDSPVPTVLHFWNSPNLTTLFCTGGRERWLY